MCITGPLWVLAPPQTDAGVNGVTMDCPRKRNQIGLDRRMVKYKQIGILIVATALCLPVYGDSAKDAYKRGSRAERQADYDAAYVNYKQAYTHTPANPKYFAAYTRMRFNAATQHVRTGQLLLKTGALKEAMAEFQHAAEIDSTSSIAQQEVQRTADMIRQQERRRSAPKIEPPAGKLAEGVGQMLELQPLSNALMTMHLTATADVAYRTIGKLAGINVVIDPDYRPQKITVDLKDVTLRQALDMVHLESKTFWTPVLTNTIIVAADSPTKRKELEQNVMRTFYLRNITSANELQDAANMVRQVLDVSHVQLLQAQDALILRGTPDQMVLAEKLLTDIDKPKSEVMIDVTVMQVSRNRIRTLGTNVPTSVSAAVVPGLGGRSGANGSSGTGGSGGSGVFTIGSFVVSVPGASFSLLSSDSNTKILQNPQIRALNNEKATLRIGDRVPIATGSFQPGLIGGGGISPLVSTQFTYLDVGVNVDITPHIHSDNEVTLKMMLEISSVTGSQDIGGITQPIIGQRRIEHETRLTDGEVNLIGGILEDSETRSLSGYPWLSKLPLLKYMFAQENKDRQENEIVFAITPHIVRARDVTEENVRVIGVGTGNSIELRRQPTSDPEHPADPAKLPQPAAQAQPSGILAPGSSRPSTPSQASPRSKSVASQ
jgi:general secretion pathway protein D